MSNVPPPPPGGPTAVPPSRRPTAQRSPSGWSPPAAGRRARRSPARHARSPRRVAGPPGVGADRLHRPLRPGQLHHHSRSALADQLGADLFSGSDHLPSLPFGWGLYIGYLAGQTGQSLGMKQSGLRLVGEDTGQPIGANQGAVRNLLLLARLLLLRAHHRGRRPVPAVRRQEADPARQDRQVGRHQGRLTDPSTSSIYRPPPPGGGRLRVRRRPGRPGGQRRGESVGRTGAGSSVSPMRWRSTAAAHEPGPRRWPTR